MARSTRSGSSSDVHVGMTEGSSAGTAIGSCIFRVPRSLSESNQKVYQPILVSIGPYHHGKPQFRMVQEHKYRFSIELLHRTHLRINELADALKPMEEKIRKCYSEALTFNSDELIEMMVVDACFIIELFCKACPHTHLGHDPLLNELWVLPSLLRDMAKLENQIPWFVLKCMFDLTMESSNDSHPSLSNMALSLFNWVIQRPDEDLKKYSDWEGEHLLDFLRSTNKPDYPETRQETNKKFVRLIQPATKLHRSGIKFKLAHRESFMDIRFSGSVLEIPVIKLDDFVSALLLNFIAFEQCHRGTPKYVTAYAIFMACLLNTSADAGFLCDCKIIERYFGTDTKVSHFFSNIGKDVVFNIDDNYLCRVFQDVNEYSEKDWRVRWAGFKNTYFSTRWSLISAVAAFVLLVLATLQTFFAVYAYYRPPSN